MNINDAFPSNYLKVEDLQGRNVTVTITGVEAKDVGQGNDKSRKMVLGLLGKTKQFVCNKTNAKTIGGLYGQETNAWIGQRITLCPREVEFQGSMVMAIRVSLQKPTQTVQAAPTPPPPPPPPVSSTYQGNIDEDVPF